MTTSLRAWWATDKSPTTISDLNGSGQTSAIGLTYTTATRATSYQERHALAGSGSWSAAATLTGNQIAGLTPGVSYDVQIRGVNPDWNGVWSNTATATALIISLSAAQDIQGAALGTAIGTLSVTGGSGTYTFTLTNTAGSTAQVAGANGVNLQDGSVAPSVGPRTITVHADNGAGSVLDQSFTITTVPQAPTIALVSGTTLPFFDVHFLTTPVAGDIATIKDGATVVVTHTLVSADISGTTVELGLSALAAGTHSITVQHTQGAYSSAFSSALVITI